MVFWLRRILNKIYSKTFSMEKVTGVVSNNSGHFAMERVRVPFQILLSGSHQNVTGVTVNNSSHFSMIILMALNMAWVTKYGTAITPVTFQWIFTRFNQSIDQIFVSVDMKSIRKWLDLWVCHILWLMPHLMASKLSSKSDWNYSQ